MHLAKLARWLDLAYVAALAGLEEQRAWFGSKVQRYDSRGAPIREERYSYLNYGSWSGSDAQSALAAARGCYDNLHVLTQRGEAGQQFSFGDVVKMPPQDR